MVLRNFDVINTLSAVMFYTSNEITQATYGNGQIGMKDVNGRVYTPLSTSYIDREDNCAVAHLIPFAEGISISTKYGNMLPGTNGTAVDYDDYAFTPPASGMLQHISLVKPSAVWSAEENGWVMTPQRILKNISGSDYVVREVGFCVGVTSEYNGVHPTLLARDVLATPLVVPNNGIFTIEMRIVTRFPVRS